MKEVTTSTPVDTLGEAWRVPPGKLFFLLMAALLAVECCFLALARFFPPLFPVTAQALFHSLIGLALLVPALQWLIVAPLVQQVVRCRAVTAALQESEARYRGIFENAVEGIFRTTAQGRIVAANPAFVKMLGYDDENELHALQLPDDLYLDPLERQFFTSMHEVRDACSGLELSWKKKSGERVIVTVYSRAIRDAFGEVTCYEGMVVDATDRRRVEVALDKANALLQKTFDSLNEAVFIVNTGTRVIEEVNGTAERMFGYSRRELIGYTTAMLHVNEEMSDHFRQDMLTACRQQGFFETTYRMRRKDGTIFESEHFVTPIFADDGSCMNNVCVVRDMTPQVRTAEKLKASLQEKDVLIKEIHHRVKNNLQIIAGLMGLQEQYVTDRYHAALFRDSHSRITTLSLIYEMLCNSPDLMKLDARAFVRNLVSNLFFSYGVSSHRVTQRVEIQEVDLDIDTAIPCGLIISELVSNSLKHAFPQERPGELVVSLRSTEGALELCVRDTGVGLPKDVAFYEAQTLGLRLVRLLVQQLEGTIRLVEAEGTAVQVVIQHGKNGK